MKLNRLSSLALAAVAVLVVACANQMEPAQKALDGVANAMTAAEAAGAGKYIPDQFKAVQGKLMEVKAAFDAKEYGTVLKNAPALLSEAQGLVGAAALRKDEVVKAANAEWTALATVLPQVVEAVKNRVDELGKSKHLPAGVDLAAAKAGLAEATAQWDTSLAAYKDGRAEDALAAAKDTKAKAEAAAAALKLKLP